MGSMVCDRKGCDNFMCRRISSIHGYICQECFDELVRSGPETDVLQFMATPPRHNNLAAAEARFEVEFPKVNEDW